MVPIKHAALSPDLFSEFSYMPPSFISLFPPTGFPHGVIDHVADIAKVAKRHCICLHVDACLGGFVLPFARQLGFKVKCPLYLAKFYHRHVIY